MLDHAFICIRRSRLELDRLCDMHDRLCCSGLVRVNYTRGGGEDREREVHEAGGFADRVGDGVGPDGRSSTHLVSAPTS